ncbi:MAG: ABC transporter ATP-binding protein [Acidithiobacillus sp.]|nr:ABC transporter ATP-binding protein [Acidithiobacillus sp.]
MTAAATVFSASFPKSPLLDCAGVSKRFGNHEVLQHISFSLSERDFVALIGPNGAGKSTLLSILIGLLRADAGHVSFLGHDIAKLGAEERLETGYVPQEFRGFEWLQAGELLDYIAAFYPRERRHWPELEDWASLPRRTRVRELSGGQRQRLAIVLALRHRPQIALLDEPVSSLDPKARRDFVQLLHADCKERGSTCLLSSHILSDLESLADRSLIMHQGRLLGDWSSKDRCEDLRWLDPVARDSEPKELPACLMTLAREAEGRLLVSGWRQCAPELRAQVEESWRSTIPADMESIFLALTSARQA